MSKMQMFFLFVQLKFSFSSKQNAKIAAGLSEKEWFHGVLPREEVVRLLVNDGDFLVRETMRHEERQVQYTKTL